MYIFFQVTKDQGILLGVLEGHILVETLECK